MNATQLHNAVLALPPDERRRVVLAALESVNDPSEVVSSPEWDALCKTELESRLDAHETSVALTALMEQLRARGAEPTGRHPGQ